MNIDIQIDAGRLASELEHLASFSDAPAPAVTRVIFTQPDLEARAWIKDLCAEAGLHVREDAAGNTFARWTGEDPHLPAVGTGSHIDAIPNSGRYDGTVGVLGGLEAIRALKTSGVRPRRSIELVIFTSEEPTRFGIGCLGSRLLSGTLDGETASRFVDKQGKSFESVRREAGFHGALSEVKLEPDYFSSFVELHIEQGPILEKEQFSIGIVTSIAAPASLRICVEGEGGHAGGVLMPKRHDALAAAAELILAVETAALESGAIDSVATTGVCDVFPGAVNSIASRVTLEMDVRDIDAARRDSVLDAIDRAARDVSAKRRVAIRSELLNADAPATSDPKVVEALTAACRAQRCSFLPIVSRAYHDSLFMSRIAPVGMLFIPCRGGISHRPDEYASAEDIANGARVLADALARLAAE